MTYLCPEEISRPVAAWNNVEESPNSEEHHAT